MAGAAGAVLLLLASIATFEGSATENRYTFEPFALELYGGINNGAQARALDDRRQDLSTGSGIPSSGEPSDSVNPPDDAGGITPLSEPESPTPEPTRIPPTRVPTRVPTLVPTSAPNRVPVNNAAAGGDWQSIVCSYRWSCSEAIAIVKAESGGDPWVWNHGGSGACGLFQHLPCQGLGDPWASAAAAFKKWAACNGGSFYCDWYRWW